MEFVSILTGMFWALVCCPEVYCNGAVRVAQVDELATIIAAAERNNCRGDDLLILLAIRKHENGGPGREFGILHPKALALIEAEPEKSLDIQAGWAAATIVSNRYRWEPGYGDFISFLGNRYCPYETDPQGNINWKRNVRYWFEKFKGDQWLKAIGT